MAHDPNSNDESSLDYQEPHDIERIHASVTREKAEPEDGLEPISLWIVTLCGICLFIGGAYLTRFSGGFQWNVYSEYAGSLGGPPGATQSGDTGGEKKELTLMEIGERTYKGCIACHGATGMGQPGVFPPLAGSEWVVGNNARLIRILLHGVQGPMTVAGAGYNGNMPAGGGASLSDEKIAGVLTYIRQAWGNDAPEISPAMVAQVRADTEGHTAQWTEVELLEIVEEVAVIEPEPVPAEEEAPAAEGEAAEPPADVTTSPSDSPPPSETAAPTSP